MRESQCRTWTLGPAWVLALCLMVVVNVGCEVEEGGETPVDGGAIPDGGDGGASPDGGVMPDGGGGLFEGCSDARFELMPTDPPGGPRTVAKNVCFHSKHGSGMAPGECPTVNYTISPHDSFLEFVDIFYGGTVCPDQFLSEYPEGNDIFIFSGVPQREPGTPSTDPLATGTYYVLGGNERGNFEYYWPTP